MAAGLTGCVSTRSAEPLNLSSAKTAAIAYYDSGTYERDIAAVAVEAEKFLIRRAARATPEERLAVVYDIDETVLSNYPHIKSQDFGYVPAVWNAWVDQAIAPAITPMRDLVLRSLELGYTVFYITGRTEPNERAPTAQNLVREGLGDYEQLIMKPLGAPGTAAVRKAEQRAAIEAEGYTIVASFGDQWSDLTGGAMERGFKLPNPFYEIP